MPSFSKKAIGYQVLTNRRRWTIQEETELKALVEGNANIEEIAAKLKKTPGAVIVKCQRLGLQLQVKGYIDTSIPLPRELPSVEEVLKILAGALKASVKPGLNRLEVQRLQTVANISKTYKEILVDYTGYREIERKMEEMEERLQQRLEEYQTKSSNSMA
jgi:hypothetical protein